MGAPMGAPQGAPNDPPLGAPQEAPGGPSLKAFWGSPWGAPKGPLRGMGAPEGPPSGGFSMGLKAPDFGLGVRWFMYGWKRGSVPENKFKLRPFAVAEKMGSVDAASCPFCAVRTPQTLNPKP